MRAHKTYSLKTRPMIRPMHPRRFLPLLIICLLWLLPVSAHAASMAERVSGKIVLDVQNHGEAWYVYPANLYRYYLGRPDDAFDIMRFLGLGITDADLAKIPTSTDTATGDRALRTRLSGRILLQVQQHGEAWYVYPGDLKRYYLGRPSDAFALMSNLGLGISATDLGQIPISTNFLEIAKPASQIQSFALTLARGTFNIDVVTLNRDIY